MTDTYRIVNFRVGVLRARPISDDMSTMLDDLGIEPGRTDAVWIRTVVRRELARRMQAHIERDFYYGSSFT